jgi:hypothetical protein
LVRDAAAGAVGDVDGVLPRRAILAGDEVAHVGIAAVPRAAVDRGEARVAEPADVVFDAPHRSGFADEVGAHGPSGVDAGQDGGRRADMSVG